MVDILPQKCQILDTPNRLITNIYKISDESSEPSRLTVRRRIDTERRILFFAQSFDLNMISQEEHNAI